jgi:hypothetical protein
VGWRDLAAACALATESRWVRGCPCVRTRPPAVSTSRGRIRRRPASQPIELAEDRGGSRNFRWPILGGLRVRLSGRNGASKVGPGQHDPRGQTLCRHRVCGGRLRPSDYAFDYATPSKLRICRMLQRIAVGLPHDPDLRKRATLQRSARTRNSPRAIWGSRGRRFKSCQPDRRNSRSERPVS